MQRVDIVMQQLKLARQAQGLSQQDMLMRIGMSQQQYQRAESASDIRMSTLLRIAEGLGLTLLLVPNADVKKVVASLSGDQVGDQQNKQLGNWSDVLKNLED